MRKLLREEDIEELLEQAEAEPERSAPKGAKQATPLDKALELQKSAGNRAVGAALQRWGGPSLAGIAQQQPKWPKGPQLIVDGQAIPLESYGEGAMNTSAYGGTGQRKDKDERFTGPGELNVVVELGDLGAEFYRAATEGSQFKTVQIVLPWKDGKGVRWILTDVVVVSFMVSGNGGHKPALSMTLRFTKREFAQTPPPKS